MNSTVTVSFLNLASLRHYGNCNSKSVIKEMGQLDNTPPNLFVGLLMKEPAISKRGSFHFLRNVSYIRSYNVKRWPNLRTYQVGLRGIL